jgi:hypothetical protein
LQKVRKANQLCEANQAMLHAFRREQCKARMLLLRSPQPVHAIGLFQLVSQQLITRLLQVAVVVHHAQVAVAALAVFFLQLIEV